MLGEPAAHTLEPTSRATAGAGLAAMGVTGPSNTAHEEPAGGDRTPMPSSSRQTGPALGSRRDRGGPAAGGQACLPQSPWDTHPSQDGVARGWLRGPPRDRQGLKVSAAGQGHQTLCLCVSTKTPCSPITYLLSRPHMVSLPELRPRPRLHPGLGALGRPLGSALRRGGPRTWGERSQLPSPRWGGAEEGRAGWRVWGPPGSGHTGRTVRLLGLPEIVVLVEGLDVVAAASLEQRGARLRDSTRGPPGLVPAQPGRLPETPRTHAVVISVDAEADLRNPVKRGAAGTAGTPSPPPEGVGGGPAWT